MENKEKIKIDEKVIDKKKLKNIKELEQSKKKYKKIRNVVFIILLIILILTSIYYIKKYIVLSNVLRANYSVDLGKNYKVTEYFNNNVESATITYYKDGVCKTGTFSEIENYAGYFYLTENDKYYINSYVDNGVEHKFYRKIKSVENYNPEKVFLFEFNALLSEPREITIKDILKYTFDPNIKISKEEYRGKEYITLQSGMKRWFANPETYYIEKQLLQGQINERIIEKDVVTNEIELPDLSSYIEITDEEYYN